LVGFRLIRVTAPPDRPGIVACGGSPGGAGPGACWRRPQLAEMWMERSKQEGREEGQTLQARKALRKLLVSRFSPLPDTVEQRDRLLPPA